MDCVSILSCSVSYTERGAFLVVAQLLAQVMARAVLAIAFQRVLVFAQSVRPGQKLPFKRLIFGAAVLHHSFSFVLLFLLPFGNDRVHGGLKALTRIRWLAVAVQQHTHIRTCNAKFGGYFVVCDLVNVHLAHKLASPGFQQNYTSFVLIYLTAAEKFAIMPLGLICGISVFGGNISLLQRPPLVVAETSEGSQAIFWKIPGCDATQPGFLFRRSQISGCKS